MSCSPSALEDLEARANARDRTGYYNKLVELHDPYGSMALGVVKQANLAGVVARCYAMAVSRRCCRPMNEAVWLAISEDLMFSDLDARRNAENFEPGTQSLRWNVIRDYHVGAFGRVGYPPETWTAWIPLRIDGDGDAPGLWRRMVTEDFLTVAVQTVWLVADRIVQREAPAAEGSLELKFRLQHGPPVATGIPADRDMAACLARMAPYELPSSGASSNERLAVFYLSVLAEDPGMMADMAAIAPTSAWRSRPSLISPAY